METTQTIILISIFNIIFTALVGGVVIYVIQKKIDATIQKSLFEYQTKFSRNYPKRVETLETLYQKLLLYIKTFQYVMLPEINLAMKNGSPIDFSKYKEANLYSDDAGKYFLNNRLFLQADTVVEIEEIFHRQSMFQLLVDWIDKNGNPPFSDDIEFAKYLIEELDLEQKIDIGSELRTDDLVLVLILFTKRMGQDTERLEKLYKSVAEAE